jgi:hypothetical protein
MHEILVRLYNHLYPNRLKKREFVLNFILIIILTSSRRSNSDRRSSGEFFSVDISFSYSNEEAIRSRKKLSEKYILK